MLFYALNSLCSYGECMEVNSIKAVATAAVRLAKNGDAFIKAVKRTELVLI